MLCSVGLASLGWGAIILQMETRKLTRCCCAARADDADAAAALQRLLLLYIYVAVLLVAAVGLLGEPVLRAQSIRSLRVEVIRQFRWVAGAVSLLHCWKCS